MARAAFVSQSIINKISKTTTPLWIAFGVLLLLAIILQIVSSFFPTNKALSTATAIMWGLTVVIVAATAIYLWSRVKSINDSFHNTFLAGVEAKGLDSAIKKTEDELLEQTTQKFSNQFKSK